MKLKIITGLSGSGKTTALRAYEDMGYYAMDNVPAYLIEKFIELNTNQANPIEQMAVVIDFRSTLNSDELYKSLEAIKEINAETEIIYLYSNDEVILKRYNELRRPHPLGSFGNVEEGIEREKDLFILIEAMADKVIDTSDFKSADLKKILADFSGKKDIMIINLVSFGYKYGLSDNFDFVFDTRFLPNPYYIEEFKHLNGTDKSLKEYLDSFDKSHTFMDTIYCLITGLIPDYINSGKDMLTIGIGCTGGQHRSVYMVESLYEKMKDDDYILVKKHREKDRWS